MTETERLLLRNSERSSYKRCRWRWNLAWNRELTPVHDAPPLRFGSLVHAALEGWYIPGRKRGVHPVKTFLKLYDEELERVGSFGMRDEDEEWHDARELGEAMMTNYVDEYGKDSHIEVIGPEMSFQIDVLNPKTGKYLVTSVGTFDGVIRNLRTGKVGLIEHKTAKSVDGELRHLALDEQAGTYWALAGAWLRGKGILAEGEDIDFILYNYLRKGLADPRPKNAKGHALNKPTKAALTAKATELELELPKSATMDVISEALREHGVDPEQLGEVSKVQPAPLFFRKPIYRGDADRENLMWRLRAEAWEIQQARKGKLPITKTPTRDCHWDCAFFDVCELHETGSDWEELINLSMTTWDPYGSHLGVPERDIPRGI